MDFFAIGLHFLTGLIAAFIGALPLGLVNLSVVDSTIGRGSRSAFWISAGASLIEILFFLLAVFLGSSLAVFIADNIWTQFFILLVLLLAAISFFLRKNTSSSVKPKAMPDFVKGMFLNILSVQVLLYWLLAVAYLQSANLIEFTAECIVSFTIAVATGKMLTLRFYSLLANRIRRKSASFAHSINLIIGSIMAVLALIQLARIIFAT